MQTEAVKETAGEVLNDELLIILRGVTESASSTKDFLVEQTPEVIQQILLWHGITSIIEMISGFILMYVMYSLYNIYGVGTNNGKWTMTHNNKNETDAHMIAWIIFYMVSFVFVINWINITWIQIWVAPKLYLIEYISRLVT